MPAVSCALSSAGFPPAAGQLQPTGQQLPTHPGHGGHREGHPLVSVVVMPVTHCISGVRQLPFPISCLCQLAREAPLAGTVRAALGYVAAEVGGGPPERDTLQET